MNYICAFFVSKEVCFSCSDLLMIVRLYIRIGMLKLSLLRRRLLRARPKAERVFAEYENFLKLSDPTDRPTDRPTSLSNNQQFPFKELETALCQFLAESGLRQSAELKNVTSKTPYVAIDERGLVRSINLFLFSCVH